MATKMGKSEIEEAMERMGIDFDRAYFKTSYEPQRASFVRTLDRIKDLFNEQMDYICNEVGKLEDKLAETQAELASLKAAQQPGDDTQPGAVCAVLEEEIDSMLSSYLSAKFNALFPNSNISSEVFGMSKDEVLSRLKDLRHWYTTIFNEDSKWPGLLTPRRAVAVRQLHSLLTCEDDTFGVDRVAAEDHADALDMVVCTRQDADLFKSHLADTYIGFMSVDYGRWAFYTHLTGELDDRVYLFLRPKRLHP